MTVPNAREQLELFKKLLTEKKFARAGKVYNNTIEWMRNFPGSLTESDKQEVRVLICAAFSISQADLDATLVGNGRTITTTDQESLPCDPTAIEAEFDAILPRRGYFRRYVDYTLHSEAPLAYHFYSALISVAATLSRRVWLDMGYYKLYPATGVILLGPSGIKKTSAANIAVGLIQDLQVTKVYSEKLTPEALVEAMRGENATGLIYAPEMSVFLSKQRYMEGIIPLLTRFMDCPDKWESGTIMRGQSALTNIGISSLMCSNVTWFVGNTPEDTFGGGFIARNLLVLQNSSPRVEPKPDPGDSSQRDKLVQELASMHVFEGEMSYAPGVFKSYSEWYREGKIRARDPEHELLETYYQRKPDHAQRMAICLHIAECQNLLVCRSCFERACAILDWTEKFLPEMLKEMFKTSVGLDQDRVLRAIRSRGGYTTHTDLVRRLQYCMNAAKVREICGSLKEAGLLDEDRGALGHLYIVRE